MGIGQSALESVGHAKEAVSDAGPVKTGLRNSSVDLSATTEILMAPQLRWKSPRLLSREFPNRLPERPSSLYHENTGHWQ